MLRGIPVKTGLLGKSGSLTSSKCNARLEVLQRAAGKSTSAFLAFCPLAVSP